MIREELVFVATCDISGLARGKGFPARELPTRLKKGVGWTGSNLMMSPFGPIWDTPFGTAGDFMIVPDPAVEVRVDFADGSAIEHFFLGDICNTDGSPWECCPRDFLRRAVKELDDVASLQARGGFRAGIPLHRRLRATGRRLRPRRLPPAGRIRRDLHCRFARRRGGSRHVSRRIRPAPVRGDGHAATGADRRRPRGHHPRDGARHGASAGASRDLLAKARPRSRRQRRAHPYEPGRRRGPAGDPRARRADGAEQAGAALLCRRACTICPRSARSPRPRRFPIFG